MKSVDIAERFGQFDIIVVGSGPAGLAASKRALQFGKRVLNLDWGPHSFPHYSALLDSKQIRITGGLGGTAHHWGGQFGTLSEVDRKNWEVLSGCSSTYFNRLDNAQKSICEAMNIDFARFLKFQNHKRVEEAIYHRDAITLVASEIGILNIYKSTVSDSNYSFHSNMKLKSIEKHKDNTRTLHFENESITIGNLPLVIAAGCIESTKVIFESFRLNKQDFPQNLSRFLSDHPSCQGSEYQVVNKPKNLPPEVFNDGTKIKNEVAVYHSDLNVYQSGIYEIRKEVAELIKNPFKRNFFRSKNMRAILYAILNRPRRSREIRTRYVLWYQVEQYRNRDSMLEFDADFTFSNWTMGVRDFELFSTLQKCGEAEMLNYSVTKTRSVEIDQSCELEQAFHPSGTLVMGLDPEEDITDLYGKVFKIPHTWIASSAMFPTAGWFNPSLIIMAFGYLAVEDIFENER